MIHNFNREYYNSNSLLSKDELKLKSICTISWLEIISSLQFYLLFPKSVLMKSLQNVSCSFHKCVNSSLVTWSPPRAFLCISLQILEFLFFCLWPLSSKVHVHLQGVTARVRYAPRGKPPPSTLSNRIHLPILQFSQRDPGSHIITNLKYADA